MVRSDAAPGLLPALARLLEKLPEGEERSRFQRLFLKATQAVDELAEERLPPWNGPPGEELRLQLAPIASATTKQVSAFLAMVREAFPVEPEPAGSDDDDEYDLFGGADHREAQPAPPRRSVRDAVAVISAIERSLSRELSTFAADARTFEPLPRLVRLAEFRGKVRAGIGEMVFLAASAFDEARREEVVPGHAVDVESSVALRRTLALLAEAVRKENVRLSTRADADPSRIASRIGAHLTTFSRTAAHQSLRAQDRAAFIDTRSRIETRLKDGADDDELRRLVEGLDRFLESLAVINRRELLIVHDGETRGAALVHLTRARAASSLAAARLELASAHRLAQRLFGRDPELDAFLRSVRRLDPGSLDAEGVAAAAGSLQGALNREPQP